jgi:uncharacterized membrane protein
MKQVADRSIQSRKIDLATRRLFFIGIAYGATAFVVSYLRYISMGAHMYDLGMFDQALWQFSQGRGFYSLLLEKDLMSHHWMPILVLLTPLYFLGFGGPWLLLLIQSTFVGLASWMCGRIMLRTTRGSQPLVCILCSISFLLSTGTQNAVMFDFHPITFSPFLALALLWLATGKRYVGMFLVCSLCLMVKEHMGLVVAGVGILTATFGKKHWGAGIFLFVFGVLGFVAVSFLGSIIGFGQDFMGRYGWLGGDLISIIRTLIMEPKRILEHMIHDFDVGSYLGRLFIPVAGLALISPRWLIPALPSLAINMLADYDLGRGFNHHYQVEILPWIYLAAFHGCFQIIRIKKLRIVRRQVTIVSLIMILGCTGYDAFKHGRLVPTFPNFRKNQIAEKNMMAGSELNNWTRTNIAEPDAVAASGSIVFPAVTHRETYQMIPQQRDAVLWDYYIFDMKKPHWDPIEVKESLGLRERIRQDGKYDLVKTIGQRFEIYKYRTDESQKQASERGHICSPFRFSIRLTASIRQALQHHRVLWCKTLKRG